jgi:hypothetical protein
VLHERWELHVERCRQFADGGWADRHSFQDLPPSRVGQGVKHCVSGCGLNHVRHHPMLGVSDLTRDSTAVEYFRKYLSIYYRGNAPLHMETRTPAKTVSLTSTGLALLSDRCWPGCSPRRAMASASICAPTNAAADNELLNCLRLRRKLLCDSCAAQVER